MKKPLKPKAPIRNTHPLLQHRLDTVDNGWTGQIPVHEKAGCKTWPRMDTSREAILSHELWCNQYYDGTGIRVEGDRCIYDMDVSDEATAKEILDDLYDLDPDAYEGAVRRNSGGITLAIIWRCRAGFAKVSTRRYTMHPEYLADLAAAYAMPEGNDAAIEAKKLELKRVIIALDPQRVEFYGPLSRGRQFQLEGVHSRTEAGVRMYEIESPATPWGTKWLDVALMPVQFDVAGRHGGLMDRAEAIMARRMTLIPEAPTAEGGVVYDLLPETLFYPKQGDADTIENLAAELEPDALNGIRGCLPWTRVSKSDANCNLFVSIGGHIMVMNYGSDTMHRMKADEPQPGYDAAALSEALSLLDAQPARGATSFDDIERGEPEATYSAAAAWLLRNVAYFTAAFKGRGGVIGIHPDSELRELVTVTSLRTRMMSFSYIKEGPRGGKHKMHPIDAWLAHPELIVIGGVRMRPEMDKPRFKEDGVEYINRYRPPAHPTSGGTVAEFARRMEAMAPDQVERAWVWNWCRCLVQHPEWRMVGLAMVAREHGSGRGLFAETLQLLLGVPFVISLPYDNISGGSKFNAEIEGRLLVYVNEARHSDSHKFGPKNAAREALRVFVEPNHRVPQRIEPKGVDAYYTPLAISTLVLANSIKAVPIDANDRRFAVVLNGPQMSVDERDEYQAWMLKPENIGALYRYLRDSAVEQNREVFDPYMAPLFVGRDMMIDAGQTDLDRAWDEAVSKLKSAADLYAMSQVVALVRSIMRSTWPDLDALVRTHTFEHGCRIGTKRPAEVNWRIRFGDDEDNRQAVFAFDERSARAWTNRGPEEIKKELFKAQKVVDEPERRFNKALRLIKNEDESVE